MPTSARALGALVPLLAALACASACGSGESRDPSEREWREPFTGMEFLHVEPGTFVMGSGPDVAMRQDDEIPHRVTLTEGYWLGKYEVTQGEWERVMGENPSRFAECPRCPVETVSRLAIERFIEALERRSPGNRFRVPTEAEWERACRAGTGTAFHTGDTITDQQANFDARYPYADQEEGGYRGAPAPVGSYPPNAWGFHDLHGNVWEWCQDRYGPYAGQEVVDPRGPETGELLVIRGGSWLFDGNSMRCALRYTHAPPDDGPSLGFRLVREEV